MRNVKFHSIFPKNNGWNHHLDQLMKVDWVSKNSFSVEAFLLIFWLKLKLKVGLKEIDFQTP